MTSVSIMCYKYSMRNILIVLIILSHSGLHTVALNYILSATNKGKIWQKDLNKVDKRDAAISLAHVVSGSVSIGLLYLVGTWGL